jgi:ribosomal RNA-processing protein 12
MPRPAWMGLSKLPMIAMFSWLATGSAGGSLYAASIVLGFCHGSLISLTIPTVSELYGLKYFGTNFMVTNTHLLAGSSVLSGVVAGYLYDLHASADTLTCYGSDCFGTTFLIYSALLAFALLLDALIVGLSRQLYARLRAYSASFD